MPLFSIKNLTNHDSAVRYLQTLATASGYIAENSKSLTAKDLQVIANHINNEAPKGLNKALTDTKSASALSDNIKHIYLYVKSVHFVALSKLAKKINNSKKPDFKKLDLVYCGLEYLRVTDHYVIYVKSSEAKNYLNKSKSGNSIYMCYENVKGQPKIAEFDGHPEYGKCSDGSLKHFLFPVNEIIAIVKKHPELKANVAHATDLINFHMTLGEQKLSTPKHPQGINGLFFCVRDHYDNSAFSLITVPKNNKLDITGMSRITPRLDHRPTTAQIFGRDTQNLQNMYNTVSRIAPVSTSNIEVISWSQFCLKHPQKTTGNLFPVKVFSKIAYNSMF